MRKKKRKEENFQNKKGAAAGYHTGSLAHEWKQVTKPSGTFKNMGWVVLVSILGAGACALISSGMDELMSLIISCI